jgi:hypothetical protein
MTDSSSSVTPGFEERRAELLEMGVPPEVYGGGALFALATNGDPVAANKELRRVAEWFEHPHPHGRDLQGEPDFAAIKLCRAWHQYKHNGVLEPDTQESIRRFFLQHDFASIYQSENHALLCHTARYLMASVFPGEKFAAYDATGATLRQHESVWLKRFIRYRASHGWGEFDSPCYVAPAWECLACLFDFSPDAELKRLAGMMMDLRLADYEVDALHGRYGGAHGRMYARHALDHATADSLLLHYLYFGGVKPNPQHMQGFMFDALMTTYRPHPAVVRLALDRDRPYENRERKHLHNVADVLPEEPLPGSVRKYTYWTPDYVMGCVQYQDPYPAECVAHSHNLDLPVLPEQRLTAGYAHHQQHEWDLSFATRSDARLFTHHPGKDGEHNYWTGDRLCGCGHFFQNRSALVALYDIPPGQSFQFIHAYVPRAAFDEIIEEHGLIFVRAGEAYGALRLLSGYRWTQEGEWKQREIVSEGSRHAVICEAGRDTDFESFAAFRAEVATNPVRFDVDRMELEYHSRRAGVLRMNTLGGRWLDGAKADLDYPLYGSAWLRAPWGAEQVQLDAGGDQSPLTLDFSERAI